MTSKQHSKPKEDLGIKIGSPNMVFWRDVKEKTKVEIENIKKMLKFNEAILEMASLKYNIEEEYFNKTGGRK